MSFAEPDAEIDVLDPAERLDLRVGVMWLLDALPSFDLKSKEWVAAAREQLQALLEQIGKEVPKHIEPHSGAAWRRRNDDR